MKNDVLDMKRNRVWLATLGAALISAGCIGGGDSAAPAAATSGGTVAGTAAKGLLKKSESDGLLWQRK